MGLCELPQPFYTSTTSRGILLHFLLPLGPSSVNPRPCNGSPCKFVNTTPGNFGQSQPGGCNHTESSLVIWPRAKADLGPALFHDTKPQPQPQSPTRSSFFHRAQGGLCFHSRNISSPPSWWAPAALSKGCLTTFGGFGSLKRRFGAGTAVTLTRAVRVLL